MPFSARFSVGRLGSKSASHRFRWSTALGGPFDAFLDSVHAAFAAVAVFVGMASWGRTKRHINGRLGECRGADLAATGHHPFSWTGIHMEDGPFGWVLNTAMPLQPLRGGPMLLCSADTRV